MTKVDEIGLCFITNSKFQLDDYEQRLDKQAGSGDGPYPRAQVEAWIGISDGRDGGLSRIFCEYKYQLYGC